MLGLIGKKVGMTQIYREDGAVVPVTVVEVSPNVVVEIKTKEKHGYSAIALASELQKESRTTKPVAGKFKKAGVEPHKHVVEFRTDRPTDYKIGQKITVEHLQTGDFLDVQGRSKGKGFQGVMKLYHFAGGNDSHGNSISHRKPGSTGQRTSPGRTMPGKKLPRRMGDETVTTKNLKIASVEVEQNLVLIRGAIPGGKKAQVCLFPHSKEFETKVLSA